MELLLAVINRNVIVSEVRDCSDRVAPNLTTLSSRATRAGLLTAFSCPSIECNYHAILHCSQLKLNDRSTSVGLNNPVIPFLKVEETHTAS
jgi:hypothetical protein